MDPLELYYKIGSHMQFSKNLYNTLNNAICNGMYSVQYFLGNPQSTSRCRLCEDDMMKCIQLVDRFPLSVFSHFPYISNLCGSVSSLAWNGDKSVDSKLEKLIDELEYELKVASLFSDYKSGVVIHPGAYPKRSEGLETIAKTINKINFSEDSKLLLENCAGEGNRLCRDFIEISNIIENIDESIKDNVGVCVDTAHIFGAGYFNLSNRDEVDKMFKEFDKYIGLSKFSLLHLNDSVEQFGSRKDRHGLLGEGYIWGKDDEALHYLIIRCQELNIPIVLETTPNDVFKFSR